VESRLRCFPFPFDRRSKLMFSESFPSLFYRAKVKCRTTCSWQGVRYLVVPFGKTQGAKSTMLLSNVAAKKYLEKNTLQVMRISCPQRSLIPDNGRAWKHQRNWDSRPRSKQPTALYLFR
jgi:hypothetical protein